jgi:hypothetical protein
VWEARNEYINNGVLWDPPRVATKTLAYIDIIMTHTFKVKALKTRPVASPKQRWVLPPIGFVCINVDAALFSDNKSMGWGSVIRDHRGTFLLSCSKGVPDFPEPEMAEAMAARNAMAMAKDWGFSKVVLVSDCHYRNCTRRRRPTAEGCPRRSPSA